MPYVEPGAFAQIFPGGPALDFPLGGYVGDAFGDDPTVFNLIVYSPVAVTGDARQVGVLFLPDPTRYAQPIPKKGWPLLCVNSGGGQGSWPPRLNIVPDEPTSNLAYQALEHGWAVWWTSIAGPALGYPSAALGHGTEDLIVCTGQGLLPEEYEHYDGPGSLPLHGGTEYPHDRYLTYRKQGQWQVQFARWKGETGQWPINPQLLAGAGISWGGDVSIAQHATPELADPAMSDFRRYSSRTQMAAALVPPFWLGALIASEGNIYGYQLPRAAAPLTDDCHGTGWMDAPSPSGWNYAHELSLERLAFGQFAEAEGFGQRWPGAPAHEALIEQTKKLRLYVVSKDEAFHYGDSTPTQFCAMSGAGPLRTLTDSGKLTCSVPGAIHSPAWQVQMAQRYFELDGSTDPGGFQRVHSRYVLPAAVIELLAGHTTTDDADAPYGPIPLQDLPWIVREDVEDEVGGATDTFVGYLGTHFAAWLEAEALDIDPSFRAPEPKPVLPSTPLGTPTAPFPGTPPPRLGAPPAGSAATPVSTAPGLLLLLAEEPERLAQQLAELLRGDHSARTPELLAEWERRLGLSPRSTALLPSARRVATIVAELRQLGSRSPSFLAELARVLEGDAGRGA